MYRFGPKSQAKRRIEQHLDMIDLYDAEEKNMHDTRSKWMQIERAPRQHIREQKMRRNQINNRCTSASVQHASLGPAALR
ncbi:unnamed protein product [Sympodiomycopsis kandeliae]